MIKTPNGGGQMNKRIIKYFFIALMFLIIININFLSASEMDQGTGIISEEILSNDSNIEIDDGDNNNGDLSDNPADNTGDGTETPEEPETPIEPATPEEPKILEKTSISSADYVIKNKYLNVTLKDSNKKVIANKKIKLTINGKTLSATTNSKGIAKFKISEAAKTYKINIKFDGDSTYNSASKTLNLRVIAKPVYTKLTLAETGIIRNEQLKIYLKTNAGKAIAKQKLTITIDGKTYTRTTDSKGLAKLKLNKSSKIYDVTIKYAGKGNYIPTSKKSKINVLNCKLIGKTSYGKVYFLSTIGNRSSKVRIAYVVGLHSMEHQIHDSLYKLMKNKVNMKYKYYIYRIVLTNKKGSYSTLRMRGQKLAKNYIVPHAKKQKFDLVVDIHSTSGITYKQTYFIHVPKNKHQPSMKLAKKTIKTIKTIEKNSKMLYWSPPTQTSPPYIHLPLIKAGTPTFVFETWSYEKKSQTDKRAKILTQAIDKIFG